MVCLSVASWPSVMDQKRTVTANVRLWAEKAGVPRSEHAQGASVRALGGSHRFCGSALPSKQVVSSSGTSNSRQPLAPSPSIQRSDPALQTGMNGASQLPFGNVRSFLQREKQGRVTAPALEMFSCPGYLRSGYPPGECLVFRGAGREAPGDFRQSSGCSVLFEKHRTEASQAKLSLFRTSHKPERPRPTGNLWQRSQQSPGTRHIVCTNLMMF